MGRHLLPIGKGRSVADSNRWATGYRVCSTHPSALAASTLGRSQSTDHNWNRNGDSNPKAANLSTQAWRMAPCEPDFPVESVIDEPTAPGVPVTASEWNRTTRPNSHSTLPHTFDSDSLLLYECQYSGLICVGHGQAPSSSVGSPMRLPEDLIGLWPVCSGQSGSFTPRKAYSPGGNSGSNAGASAISSFSGKRPSAFLI